MATTFPIKADTSPAVKSIDQLIAELRKTGKEAGLSERQINEMVMATKQAGTVGAKNVSAINKEMGVLTTSLRNVASGFGALIAVDKLAAIGRKVIEVRAEFEKLEAVLTNTLGSKSRAQDSLRMIQEIASKTPYSVLQLTQSYVKLVNQGFKPTSVELLKLGDLAAAVGKEFDQLTEAIIDAQTGEFERLKDFGIRASKEGDRVTFTFKDVKTQVDFTSESIRNYILSLGDLQGVSGSAAAISETLTGKISNLGDSINTLANKSGEFLSPVLGDIIGNLKGIIDILTEENLSKVDKLLAIIGGNKSQRDTLLQILTLQRELLSTEKERAIQSTVDAALASENVEAYIMALDSNINKEEIIARIREKQAKDLSDTQAEAEARLKKSQEAEKLRLDGLKKSYDELYLLTKKFNDSLTDSFNASLAGAEQGLVDAVNNQGGAVDPFAGLIDGLPPEVAPEIEGLKTYKEIEAEKQRLKQQTYDHAVELGNNLAEFYQNRSQLELQALQNQYQQEVILAGDNQEAKDKLSREFQRKQYEIQNEQNQRQNEQAIFQILSSQGPALAKTISTSGYPAAFPLTLLVLAQFGLLLANQRKLQPPRFAAKGDFDIDGPGGSTSDSIPYFLSRHETVEPAHATKKFGELLKPMLDPNFDWKDIRNIVDRRLPSGAAPAIIVQASNSESSPELIAALSRLQTTIEKKPETRIQMDENGFSRYVGRGHQWTKYIGKRYTP
jgi:hypothetical protein